MDFAHHFTLSNVGSQTGKRIYTWEAALREAAKVPDLGAREIDGKPKVYVYAHYLSRDGWQVAILELDLRELKKVVGFGYNLDSKGY